MAVLKRLRWHFVIAATAVVFNCVPAQSSEPAMLSDDDMASFSSRFESTIWPMLTRGKAGCVSCHDGDNKSQLEIPDSSEAAFKKLLGGDYLNPKSPSGILARVTSQNKKLRMPPGSSKPWSKEEIASLKSFVNDLTARQRPDAAKMDEAFPAELLMAFVMKDETADSGNTFITYYQLRKKVKTIFNDDWRREDRDKFADNIALFGGADFNRSFNESSKASATFLSGIDAMGIDIAARAYSQSSGPFVGRAQNLSSPLKMKGPDGSYKKEITRLFNRTLFRDPSPQEMSDAFRFVQNIYTEQEQLAQQQQTLRFSLEVADAEGMRTRRDFSIPVINDECGLYQEYMDQNAPAKDGLARKKLSAQFTFKAGSEAQLFQMSNEGTSGNVSIAGIEVSGPLPGDSTQQILIKDPSVKLFGAWKFTERTPPSYDDNNENKGGSSMAIPIRVQQDGKYEITVLWRLGEGGAGKKSKGAAPNASNVLVEVLSHDATRHALLAPPAIPPKGEAHFKVDQTVDNVAYTDLQTVFQFGESDGVEINNAGTKRPVVADAVYFIHDSRTDAAPAPRTGKKKGPPPGERLTVKGIEAEGGDKWPEFKTDRFKPYNTVGPKLFSDNNEKKGELKLLYKPSTRKEEWKPEEFYRVRIVAPGKADNETQAPVIVHAEKSSPIIQINPPLRLHVGAPATLDASNSFNLQRSNLAFTWQQTGGPRVKLPDAKSPKISFEVPALSAQQASWEGLCRALLHHPDFLFTRPPSLATVKDKDARKRLQLVKIAQDLVARPPNAEELKRFEKGATLAQLADEYLASQEFKDFYFHRIRLTLESHGSESDDEPTRLWCYVCNSDLPFKEILTADYTVDKNFEKQPRPEYHGKTGLLTMRGFIDGKPGLPHFNYAAIVCEKFLGYVFEVPASIVAMREGATAISTTSPESSCYSCHKILTPLAFQRTRWNDKGVYADKDEKGKAIDDSDQKLVASYPFKGSGMEAFAIQAQNKERFIRTMIQTHFVFYFGREMRHDEDERALYRRLWENCQSNNFAIRPMIKAIVTSPEYLDANPWPPPRGK